MFSAKGGARVTFARLTGSTGVGFPAFTASEASTMDLPVLQTLAGSISGIFPDGFVLRANSGSRLDLPALDQSPTGRILFVADGSNSVVRLGAIHQLDGPASGAPGSLEVSGGGRVEIPQLVRLQGTTALVRTGGRLDSNSNPVIINTAEIVLEPLGTLLSGPLTLETDGILSGNGAVPAAVVNAGTVRPGTPSPSVRSPLRAATPNGPRVDWS